MSEESRFMSPIEYVNNNSMQHYTDKHAMVQHSSLYQDGNNRPGYVSGGTCTNAVTSGPITSSDHFAHTTSYMMTTVAPEEAEEIPLISPLPEMYPAEHVQVGRPIPPPVFHHQENSPQPALFHEAMSSQRSTFVAHLDLREPVHTVTDTVDVEHTPTREKPEGTMYTWAASGISPGQIPVLISLNPGGNQTPQVTYSYTNALPDISSPSPSSSSACSSFVISNGLALRETIPQIPTMPDIYSSKILLHSTGAYGLYADTTCKKPRYAPPSKSSPASRNNLAHHSLEANNDLSQEAKNATLLSDSPEIGSCFRIHDSAAVNSTNKSNRQGISRQKLTSLSETKRQIHIQSEQKRRAQIKDGFEDLRNELPSCLNKKMNKVTLLHRTVQHIQYLKSTQITIMTELERLINENEQLRKFQESVLQKQALEKMYHINSL